MNGSNRTPAEDACRLGAHLADRGDLEAARGAFLSSVAFGDPEWSPRAAATLGDLLWKVGDPAGAEPILWVAIDSGHPDWSAGARVTLGVVLADRGDLAGAERTYEEVIATGHPTHATNAWFNLGTLHQQAREFGPAVAAFRRVVATGHPQLAPKAAVNLGFVLFTELGDAAGAERAFRVAIASDDPEQAALAGDNLTAMRRLLEEGAPTTVTDDEIDVATGRTGSVKWRFWTR